MSLQICVLIAPDNLVAKQQRCRACGAIDGFRYPCDPDKTGKCEDETACTIDPRTSVCNREACMLSRGIPDESTNEQRGRDRSYNMSTTCPTFNPNTVQLSRWKNRKGSGLNHSGGLSASDPHLTSDLRLNRTSLDESLKRIRGKPGAASGEWQERIGRGINDRDTSDQVLMKIRNAVRANLRETAKVAVQEPDDVRTTLPGLFIETGDDVVGVVRERQRHLESVLHLRRPKNIQELIHPFAVKGELRRIEGKLR